ncbi:MAG: type II toxin-antitoxin system HicA family toxin [Tildeniella nuda ZEHNDER 1965/U140]|nr:type II toxin-antitoxin system HicA family toxin [Tildeniella nuda ZEHNDER 1965/U140]
MLLEAFGFVEKRSKGSHHTFEDDQGQVFTIPKKGGKKVRRVYIKRIVELLNLQQWQDESSDQSTDDN